MSKHTDELNHIVKNVILNVIGIISGNQWVFLVDSIPEIIRAIHLEDYKDKELALDLKKLIKGTRERVQRNLQGNRKTLSRAFSYIGFGTDKSIKSFTISELVTLIYESISAERKWGSIDLTDNDQKELIKVIIISFSEEVLKYPRISQYINFKSLEEHEARLGNLEVEPGW